MDYAATLSAVRALSLDEQCLLIQEVSRDMEEEMSGELDEDTKRILDERIADMEANPDDEVSLDQALAEIRAWLRQ